MMADRAGQRLIFAAQVAGVLATGWFVWVTAVLPRIGLPALGWMIAETLFYVMAAWICGAIVTFGIYIVVSLAEAPEAARFSLGTSSPAMWFAPAIVLLSTPLVPAFAVSVFLIGNATRHLMSRWTAIESPLPPAEAAYKGPALLTSTTAQLAAVAMLWSHPFLGAALLALSTALLTSLALASGAYRPGKLPALPHPSLSLAWTFLLAASLTLGGISVRARGLASLWAKPGSSDTAGQTDPGHVADRAAPEDDGMGPDGTYPGVVLLPTLKPYTTLFVPVRSPFGRFGAPLAKPVGIAFSGVYWMYRWPLERPPRRSIIRRGSAAELSFHTTDGWRLEMEARQKLDPPVSAHCCSEIHVEIQNNDPFPGTVALQLSLIDTSVPFNLVQKLGAVPVGSPSAGEQTLNFPFPAKMELEKFDEIKIVFRRDWPHIDKSARIAIERFVFVP